MVERAAKGADLLIHEALQPDMVQTLADDLKAAGRAQTGQIMHDILDYHASPAQAADRALREGVRLPLLTHIVPALPSRHFDTAFLDGAKRHFGGPLILQAEEQTYPLPPGSTHIRAEKARAGER